MQSSNSEELEFIEYEEQKVADFNSRTSHLDDSDDQIDECCFEHADMKKQNRMVVTLGKYDPRAPYLTVYPGLSLKGTCKNEACIAKDKNVWIKKSYGKFNIGQARCGNKCPCCQTKMAVNSFTTIGYRNAKVQFVGSKLINEEEEDFSFVDEEKQGKFILFKDSNDSICKWAYLEVEVTEIKP